LTEIISNHMICRLPAASVDVWLDMIQHYVDEFFVSMGLIIEAAIHQPPAKSPHVHFQTSRRKWLADNTFSDAIYHATSFQTRERWQQGWVAALADYGKRI
jgi:hypothetical protein